MLVKATRKPVALAPPKIKPKTPRKVFMSITEVELATVITALDWQPDEMELQAKLGSILADSILSHQL